MDQKNEPKILFAHYSICYSFVSYYEKILRKKYPFFSIGSGVGLAEINYFKKLAEINWEFATKEQINLFYDSVFRQTRKNDLQLPTGKIDLGYWKEKIPFEPDLFIWGDSYNQHVIPVNFQYLKCPKVALIGDCHVDLEWRLEFAKEFDFIFLLFADYLEIFKKAGCKNVYWLPPACHPPIYPPYRSEKKYDISFCGSTDRNYHQQRNLVLKKLLENGFSPKIGFKLLDDLGLIYSQSKIVINHSLKNDLNMRIFEAMGSGALLFTNNLPPESRLTEMFTEDKEIVFYDNNNLLTKLREYLENENKREEISRNGKNKVLNFHTYEQRVSDLLKIIQTKSK